MIAILIASRGLIFAETDKAIDEIVDNFDCKVIRSFNKKIPDAQNYLVEEALKTKADFFLFIEEDNAPTLEQIRHLINREVDIAFIDYAVSEWSCSARNKSGEIL